MIFGSPATGAPPEQNDEQAEPTVGMDEVCAYE